ncbi:MAG TPA: SdpI family protein [Ignavibacteriaceae bacterium]|nr:SdpI family protein [Ignavibacteriaceae bacterium]
MKWHFKRDLFPIAMIIAFLFVSWYFYGILPDTVPSHFNSKGMPDGYSSKTTVIAIGIGASIGLYLLLTFIPMIDPFWKKIEKKYNIFLLFRDILIAFIVFILVIDFISAKEGFFRSDLMGIGFGVLFIIIGNYLPKLPRNFFFGIRSPWTLASEEVWHKTHRIGGTLFVIGGAIMIILILLKVELFITIISVLVPISIYSGLIYPYFLYKKLEKEGKLKKPEL